MIYLFKDMETKKITHEFEGELIHFGGKGTICAFDANISINFYGLNSPNRVSYQIGDKLYTIVNSYQHVGVLTSGDDFEIIEEYKVKHEREEKLKTLLNNPD